MKAGREHRLGHYEGQHIQWNAVSQRIAKLRDVTKPLLSRLEIFAKRLRERLPQKPVAFAESYRAAITFRWGAIFLLGNIDIWITEDRDRFADPATFLASRTLPFNVRYLP